MLKIGDKLKLPPVAGAPWAEVVVVEVITIQDDTSFTFEYAGNFYSFQLDPGEVLEDFIEHVAPAKTPVPHGWVRYR